MDSDSQLLDGILNWVLLFAVFGGSIYTGSRYGRLALQYGKNRFMYAALGFVGFIAAIQFFGTLLRLINRGPSMILALTVPVIAGVLAIVGYKMLKRKWD